MRARLVVMLAMYATACGRIGFDDLGGDGDDAAPDPKLITVTVRGEPEEPDAGQPIAGATVVFAGANGIETLTTGPSGSASATVDGPTTIHVGYRTLAPADPVPVDSWRLYTVEDVPGGSRLLLGFAPFGGSASISVTLPVLPLATRYELRGPMSCSIDGGSPSNVVATTINNCTGETVPIYGIAFDAAGEIIAWLEAGMYLASDGAQYTTAATWQPPTTETVRYTGTPSSLLVSSDLARHHGADRVIIGEAPDPMVLGDHDDRIPAFATSVDSMRTVYISSSTSSTGGYVCEPAPPDVGGVRTFDISRLVSWSENVVIDSTGAITWTQAPIPRQPTLLFAQFAYTTTANIPARWVRVGQPATRVDVPVLPAPLDAITPLPSTITGLLAGFSTGSLAYEEVVPTIFDTVFSAYFIEEIPIGWGLTIAQVGTLKRPARPTRMQHLVRRVLSAAD